MKLSKTSGVTIAAAAAALLLGGATLAPTQVQAEEKVKCFGLNSCKGKGSCKTASNECKGKNGCQGKGFKELTAAECTDQGGTTTQPS
jgi:hypothetical protein